MTLVLLAWTVPVAGWEGIDVGLFVAVLDRFAKYSSPALLITTRRHTRDTSNQVFLVEREGAFLAKGHHHVGIFCCGCAFFSIIQKRENVGMVENCNSACLAKKETSCVLRLSALCLIRCILHMEKYTQD